jgi:hypothetical protein
MLESRSRGCRVLSGQRVRTRETPRELLPKLPPSRGSSQSTLAGTPVSKRPCEHSDPTPGRSPVPVRSVAESPKAPRRGALSGPAAAPCGVRRERHDEPLPARRGLRDRSCSTPECRGSPRCRQPPEEPGFRASDLLFARPGPAAGLSHARGRRRRARREMGRTFPGELPGEARREDGPGGPQKRDPEEALAEALAPSGPQPFAPAPLSETPWR